MKSVLFLDSKDSRKLSLKELASESIRSAIISGQLKPGQQLFQEKIAETLHVSIIPVREALSALHEEGFVEFFANRGAFVSEIRSSDVKELYEIRFFLESAALSLSIPNLQDSDFAEAERFMDLYDKTSSVNEKRQSDLQFHSTLYQPCGRPRLLALINQMQNHVTRYMNLCIYLMHFKSHPKYNHQKILYLCKAGKIGEAVECLRKHLEVAKELVSASFEG